MKRCNATRWSVAATLSALALVAGCSDSGTGPGHGDGYPDQSTPDNVIEKLETAYESMDTDAYTECLAEDFAFLLNPDDVGSDPTLPEYWHKAEEQVMHGHMFADTTVIESISLTLTAVSTDSLAGDDPGDPSDDLWEYTVDVDLRVQAGLTYLSSGTSLFVMKRAPDRTDVVWQILEHHDLGGDRIRGEETTWTGIKLTFGGAAADSLYPTRSTPENLLRKLDLAYERMDTEAYLDCLAEDLIFYLNPDDVTQYPELPESWHKAEEEQIHRRMFGDEPPGDPGLVVERIWLTFTHISAVYDPGPTGDALDDVWTYVEDVDLHVALPPDLTLHAQAPEQFVIEVDPDETGPGGQLLWEIALWYDLSEEGRVPGPLVEDSSWGSIKALWL